MGRQLDLLVSDSPSMMDIAPEPVELPRKLRAPYQPPLFPVDEQHADTPPSRVPQSHKPRGLTYSLLRWPLLGFILCTIFFELVLYGVLRASVATYEFIRKTRSRSGLSRARTYGEWRAVAEQLDARHGKDEWKQQDDSPFYDAPLVRAIVDTVRRARTERNADALARALQSACKNNVGGVENEQLYSHTYAGTKDLVQEYVNEVTAGVAQLAAEAPAGPQKQTLLRKIAKAYGRTALCLSGGASFGYYHLGVVKALLDNDALPSVISGTSAGSLIGAFVCCHTDEELKRELNPGIHVHFKANDEPLVTVLWRLVTEGSMFDEGRWIKKMQEHITLGDMTFLEAYERTGRALNVCVASEERFSPPFCLNYKTTPNVVIWSAVLASAAVPGVLHAIELRSKRPDGTLERFHGFGRRWRDGVLRSDIPATALHQLFGVKYTIVSQVNPHVVPFFFENRGSSGRPTLHLDGGGWRGGFVASFLEDYLKLDMVKWLQVLQDLHLLPRILGQDWSYVFLQHFGGTVTIVPPVRLSDYIGVISDPDENRMGKMMRRGELITWPKIAMIQNRIRIERAIADAQERAYAEANK